MDQSRLRIVFAGTPEFGIPALDALYTSKHQLVAVYTQPDRPSGRGQAVQASPIKQWAVRHQIPVYQPENFRQSETREELAALSPDLLVVIAYGLILPQSVLAIPKHGCINVHSSLLPCWRGAAPIQSAILHGDAVTGVTVMQLDAGMDTGPILALSQTSIDPHDTAGSLHDRLSQMSIKPLLEVIESMLTGQLTPIQQDASQASYSKKIMKEEAHINWTQKASDIERAVRAYHPWPIAYTFSQTHRIRVFEVAVETYQGTAKPGEIIKMDAGGILVATGEGGIRIKQFQFPGGKVLLVSDWLHACSPPLVVGQCLG